ncbi:MAG: hypothetical protein OWQ48_00650 [Desulfurococcus sp.]|nr:hypothetical protein [Desulfurococcus sp.]
MSEYSEIHGVRYDRGSLGLLGDAFTEAQLLLKTKYIEDLTLNLQVLLDLLKTRLGKGSYLLSCYSDEKRYVILLEEGVVKSVAYTYITSGGRIAGYVALEDLIADLRVAGLNCRLSAIVAEAEEKTTVAQPPEKASSIESKVVETTPLKRDMDSLRGFLKHLRDIISDTASLYGCTMTGELAVEERDGVLVVRVKLGRKGIFGKCRGEELKRAVDKDLPLLTELHDLRGVKVVLEVVFA